jgi:CDP-glycerol glycerophosphotransferase (TagB/SpsB family)
MSKKYLFYIAQNYSFAMLRPLQDEIRCRGDEVKWYLEANVNANYLTTDEQQLTDISSVVSYNPYAVFVPGNVVPHFIPGIKVGVFHGFDAGKMNRRGQEDHYQIRGCFDMYCTFGEKVTNRFQHLAQQHGYFDVVNTGWAAVDPLFDTTKNHNPYVVADDKRPTILLCSTFSRNLTCAPHVYDTIKQLSKTGEWRWLVQFHPKMDQEIIDKYKALENDNLSFIETDNVIPLLQSADAMLCDTSSVLLMFLLQSKPVVTFNGNQKGPHLLNVTTTEDIEPTLRQALSHPAKLMLAINDYIQSIHNFTDGKSSSRVLDAVEQFSFDKLEKSKPFNLIRQIKLRKKLKYWKL